jgi:hypothetical protein
MLTYVLFSSLNSYVDEMIEDHKCQFQRDVTNSDKEISNSYILKEKCKQNEHYIS